MLAEGTRDAAQGQVRYLPGVSLFRFGLRKVPDSAARLSGKRKVSWFGNPGPLEAVRLRQCLLHALSHLIAADALVEPLRPVLDVADVQLQLRQ